ncbi:hypothetical protein [Pseudarthrobacter sp. PS3-L1]|uniref:hypothetical protein n=1 Tax=Pseudarthrobacter sp. PS3-L1 TaxID=3046207 RepID=UPI0024BB1265|nr:hypothetical protein [Pseudarthrobacter sp. PS3-L1]MDJ0321778.1 hypothetical protein [Pseudarthrobacter sp. PS3-L1]
MPLRWTGDDGKDRKAGALLDGLVERTGQVWRVVLMTDAGDAQRAFHQSRGFLEGHDGAPAELRSFALFR